MAKPLPLPLPLPLRFAHRTCQCDSTARRLHERAGSDPAASVLRKKDIFAGWVVALCVRGQGRCQFKLCLDDLQGAPPTTSFGAPMQENAVWVAQPCRCLIHSLNTATLTATPLGVLWRLAQPPCSCCSFEWLQCCALLFAGWRTHQCVPCYLWMRLQAAHSRSMWPAQPPTIHTKPMTLERRVHCSLPPAVPTLHVCVSCCFRRARP